jgi:uncharacterized protein (TIGR03435 family)
MDILRSVACVLVFSSLALAQAPAAFEVASIRPTADQVGQTGIDVHLDGSQLRATGLTLKNYVGLAFGVRPRQIVSPDWLGQLRFDIAATISAGTPATQVPAMLRALLEERFMMKAHRETRELPVYALQIAQGGLTLKESAPRPEPSSSTPPAVGVTASANATGAGADLGGGSSFWISNSEVQVQRFTMRVLAELLTRFCDRPVIDETSNAGVYDAAFALTPEEMLAVKLRAAVNGDAVLSPQALRLLDTGPADPWSNALQKAGLVLAPRKSPLDIVVIDSMQKTPTQN